MCVWLGFLRGFGLVCFVLFYSVLLSRERQTNK